MDVVDTEAWSCIKQSMVRFMISESQRLHLPPTHHLVINSVIQYFNGRAPLPNQCLKTVVLQLAQTCPDPNL